MIQYTKVGWTNFLQTGNDGVEIQLDANHLTLIKGLNGSGKSTILDALCFALYGKPFRKVTKPLLVNTINGKGTLVWIEFRTRGKSYRIERGIKPNKLELYENGVLVPQSAEVKDYQVEIDNILNCSHKTFTQVDILGSAKYTPFMELKTPERREVVEDLLDVAVFSEMAKIGKVTKDTMSSAISAIKAKVLNQETIVRMVLDQERDENADKQARVDEIQALISELSETIEKLQLAQEVIGTEALEIRGKQVPLQPIRDTLYELTNQEGKILAEGQSSAKIHTFLRENSVCPTCHQEINKDHAQHMTDDAVSTMKDLAQQRTEVRAKITAIHTQMEEATKIDQQISDLKSRYSVVQSQITSARTQRDQYLAMVGSLMAPSKKSPDRVSSEEAKAILDSLKEELGQAERDYDDVLFAMSLLKDDGIKASVIDEYIPLFNKLINDNLDKMNLFCQFTLDNQFDETIHSRYRDQFKYESFSEGQKFRINLAILFAWRQVTKLKNSVSSNLLFLDEVLDGSLDLSLIHI